MTSVASKQEVAGETTPETVIVDGPPPYALCDSQKPFVNPFVSGTPSPSAQEKNESLNLAFGKKWLRRENNKKLLEVIRRLNECLFLWWEQALYPLFNRVPVAWRRFFAFAAWSVYFPIHKAFLGRSTAIHPDASPEYHAVYTGMWFARYFPITLQRLRFSLEQLSVAQRTPKHQCHQELIHNATVEIPIAVPEEQKDNSTVTGVYLHQKTSTEPTDYILFYFFGGAFLAGDHIANIAPAETLVDGTMDVYIPKLLLGPEGDMPGVLFQIAMHYRYLYHRRQREGKDPRKILLFGCSSGAAYAMMLCQFLTALDRGEEVCPEYVKPVLQGLSMPCGGAFASPFVDYRTERESDGSFFNYNKHDLMVNEAMQDMGLRYFKTHIFPRYSPLSHPCEGLPPMCIVLSEHETVHDENILLINKIRAAGIPCSVAYFRYMCHCWCFLGGLIPEGRFAMEFMTQWLKDAQKEKEIS